MEIPGSHKKHRGVKQSTRGLNRLHKGYTHMSDIASQLMTHDKKDKDQGPGLFMRVFRKFWFGSK